MPPRDLLDIIDDIRERKPRYRREAYVFVMNALDHVVRRLPAPRHVSGQELLRGVVDLAREEFGPLAPTVFEEWGLTTGTDVGEIVFALVDAGVLGKQPDDRLEDFEGGIDLAQELQPGGGE
jgi:uncharacterized repeat protein (TIGR04138 family)